MGKKIIFYGGCQGVGKSHLLESAKNILTKAGATINIINISGEFDNCIKDDTESKDKSKVIWFEDDWKQYDKDVLSKLIAEINSLKGIVIINCHFSVLYKGIDNYLPGFELTSVRELLKKTLFDVNGKILGTPKKPIVGTLLIDPEPSVLIDYYKEAFKAEKANILNYLSRELIVRDIEHNRLWANSYRSIATEVLPKDKDYVEFDTIRITREISSVNKTKIVNEIINFIKRFED